MKKQILIKAKHNLTTKLVNGHYPSNINYKNNKIDTVAKTIDGEPYIEISEKEWKDNGHKQMIIDNDIYKEYVKSDAELLQEVKNQAIGNRKQYLKSSFEDICIDYEPDNIPKAIKDKRILVRKEIKQIEQETDIKKIIIKFE